MYTIQSPLNTAIVINRIPSNESKHSNLVKINLKYSNKVNPIVKQFKYNIIYINPIIAKPNPIKKRKKRITFHLVIVYFDFINIMIISLIFIQKNQ